MMFCRLPIYLVCTVNTLESVKQAPIILDSMRLIVDSIPQRTKGAKRTLIMTIKEHNGKWDTNYDAIDILSSMDQNLPRTTGAHSISVRDTKAMPTIPYSMSLLGLDTEMLMKVKDKTIWPHEQGMPQERKPKEQVTSGGHTVFDFHGDGFAMELCIQPVHCLEYMMRYVSTGLDWFAKTELSKLANKKTGITPEDTNITLHAPAIYKVPQRIVDAAPDDVKRLGCMPSVNVYGDPGIPGGLGKTKRTTGCHLHISHPALTSEDVALAVVRWADILVGCAWTYISPEDPSDERERRTAYGRAGEYRLKVYPCFPEAADVSATHKCGVEYRVLPGTVLHHPGYLTLMFNLYRTALRYAALYGNPQKEISFQAKNAINDADRDSAKVVLDSLPFKASGKTLLQLLHDAPLKVASLKEWVDIGSRAEGHQFLGNGSHGHVLGLQPLPYAPLTYDGRDGF